MAVRNSWSVILMTISIVLLASFYVVTSKKSEPIQQHDELRESSQVVGQDPLIDSLPLTQTDSSNSPLSRYAGNGELAKAHYYLDESGEVVLPTDVEMKFSKHFTFSDGESIEISFIVERRYGSLLSSDLDDGVSADFFLPLNRAALDGNDQAGVIAYQEVVRCSKLHRSSPEKSDGQRCSQVSSETLEEAERLLHTLADSGNAVAQELHARHIMSSDPMGARRTFNLLWDAGFTGGLGGLRETAPPSSELDYEQLIEAEALSYASFVVTMAYLDGVPNGAVIDHVNTIAEQEQQRLNGFSPGVQKAIELRAKELLVENKSCCRSFVSNTRS